MKLKLIAAAAVLAASGAANAAIDTGATTGNGSLVANLAYGNNSAGSSAAFDLGITFSDVATWNSSIASTVSTGTEWYRSWNLATGELSGTGLTTSVVGSYGNTLATFNAAAASAGATNTTELSLFAFDGTGVNPGEASIFTTGNSISATGGTVALTSPSNSTFNQIQGSTTVTNFLVAVNNSGTNATDANGASFASAGSNAYFNNGTGMAKLAQTSMFDTNGQINGSYAAGTTAFAGDAKSIAFYSLMASSITGTQKATLSAIGYDVDGDGIVELGDNGAMNLNEAGLWTLQGNELRFTVAAAVPEPETYAMLLAGLGLMGAVARRRRNVR